MNIQMKKRSRSVYKITKDYARQDGYNCRTCNKRFDSFQALGGHQGTHKRVKHSDTSDMCSLNLHVVHRSSGLHRCKTCMKEFETGQALGGHMRCHRIEKDLILKDKGCLWRKQAVEKAESDLMLVAERLDSDLMLVAAEKVESGLKLAERDLKITNSDLKLAKSDLMLVAAEKADSGLKLAESDLKLTESDLKLVESDLMLAESDLKLAKSDLKLAESDLMLAAVEVEPLKSEEDKPKGDKGKLVMAAKEWRLFV